MEPSLHIRDEPFSLYPYNPSHVLPIVFAVLVFISLVLHVYQNIRYSFWKTTFWITWGATVFTTGWILRTISSYHTHNLNLYIASTVFIYAGPPIYAASAYNIVGRLLHYLPMHATQNPNRVVILYIYLGALVEALTAAGAARLSAAGGNLDLYQSGGKLIAASTVLQAVIESTVILNVALVHHRAATARMLPRNVRTVCITLYGTSCLIILRCVFRAVEAFALYTSLDCLGQCGAIARHEWYLYALEAAPMVIFTYWLNVLHPGRFLPRNLKRYLDFDGLTERVGPGWTDLRATWLTYYDPLDLGGCLMRKKNHDEYWLRGEEWPVCEDGSFARRTGSNVRGGRQNKETKMLRGSRQNSGEAV